LALNNFKKISINFTFCNLFLYFSRFSSFSLLRLIFLRFSWLWLAHSIHLYKSREWKFKKVSKEYCQAVNNNTKLLFTFSDVFVLLQFCLFTINFFHILLFPFLLFFCFSGLKNKTKKELKIIVGWENLQVYLLVIDIIKKKNKILIVSLFILLLIFLLFLLPCLFSFN